MLWPMGSAALSCVCRSVTVVLPYHVSVGQLLKCCLTMCHCRLVTVALHCNEGIMWDVHTVPVEFCSVFSPFLPFSVSCTVLLDVY